MDANLIPIVIAVGVAALVVIVLFAIFLLLVFRPRKAAPTEEAPDLSIDVATLNPEGPSDKGLALECYSVPVRLGVLVLAPVGRAGSIPSTDQLLNVVDQLVPGLVEIVSEDQPVVRFWPRQLSSQGFVTSFFHKLGLPGDRGKGSVWCAVAGKFAIADQQYLVGLALCAAANNGLGQVTIEHDGQWNDVIRIRR